MSTRSTIDFGIDLGTTNSAIAVLKGRDTEIFKNNDNSETTPSAVWINKTKELFVGKTAKERAESDPENAFQEFKRKMGTKEAMVFKRSGRRLLPEELSAEVLKQLRADVQQRTGEEVTAAVITVPADFELPQNQATEKAARLAGLEISPLLQEPVAAALAYGFNAENSKAYWLVYDFGGGTFDAALMQVRDGNIQVVNHGGDNYLGGKDIDWGIVEQLLIPALLKETPLRDFKRGNPAWMAPLAKLKLEAEKAKIRLSREDSAEILLEYLCADSDGAPVPFEYTLRRTEVEKILQPLVMRSINKCRQVLSERKLDPGQVAKLVLVGGPTLTPYLRQLLSDPREGLGIPVDFSVDPLTIVARGAACFAGAQRVEGVGRKAAVEGNYGLELSAKFKNVGTDTEPLVGGRIIAPGSDPNAMAGFTLEILNPSTKPPWRSGKLPLKPDGAFVSQLFAQKNIANVFQVELTDPTGTRIPVVPNTINYTVGLIINEQPMIHSLGLALANNDVSWIFRKGAGLPATKTDRERRTAKAVRAGQADDALRIVVVEGEKDRADRNNYIGELRVEGPKIKRDLPANSEIEISFSIDASRLITVKAYIPILDAEFEDVIRLDMHAADPAQLTREFEGEKKRLTKLAEDAKNAREPLAEQVLAQIESEGLLAKIASLLEAGRNDNESANACQKSIRELRSLLDECEETLEWPTLVTEVNDLIAEGRRTFPTVKDRSEERNFETLVREAEGAIQRHQVDVLRRKLKEMQPIVYRLYQQSPDFWVNHFQRLESMRADMPNQTMANALFAQGTRSINSGDVNALTAAVRQLYDLLPQAQQQTMSLDKGDIL